MLGGFIEDKSLFVTDKESLVRFCPTTIKIEINSADVPRMKEMEESHDLNVLTKSFKVSSNESLQSILVEI